VVAKVSSMLTILSSAGVFTISVFSVSLSYSIDEEFGVNPVTVPFRIPLSWKSRPRVTV